MQPTTTAPLRLAANLKSASWLNTCHSRRSTIGRNPSGDSPDFIARLLGEKLAAALGKPVVIDNVPGASGSIGKTQGLIARNRYMSANRP